MANEQANLETGASSGEQEPSNQSNESNIESQIGALLSLESEVKGEKKKKPKVTLESDGQEDEESSNQRPDGEKKKADKDEDKSKAKSKSDADDESEEESESEEDTDKDVSEEEEDAEPEFNSLEELAEAAGMSIADIKALIKDKITVQGKEIEVTYDQLLKGQMLESDYRLKTQALAEERKEFSESKAKQAEVMKSQVDEGVLVLQAMYADYLSVRNDTDWEKLKQIDPVEYSIKRTEVSDKFQKLEQYKQGLAKHNARLQEKLSEEVAAKNAAFMQQQRDALQMLIPSWISQDAKKEGVGEVRKYLTDTFVGDLAFSKQELDGLSDARIVYLAKMAMEYEKTKSRSDFVKKRIATTRKITKANGRSDNNVPAKKAADYVNKVRKTGDIKDAANAILALGTKRK